MHQFLARVLDDIASGAHPRESFHTREAECMEGLRRDIVILSALTAVAPLLGLLGTVRGMIGTFGAVAQVAGDTGTEVAGGISQALITTQFGLLVALPGVFSVSRLKSLVSEAQQCMGSLRAQVMAILDGSGPEVSA
jgi:biopolymer transport protein ExbB